MSNKELIREVSNILENVKIKHVFIEQLELAFDDMFRIKELDELEDERKKEYAMKVMNHRIKLVRHWYEKVITIL